MFKVRWLRLFCIIMMTAILGGCGAFANPTTPTPLPTLTPLPLTDTPVPPSDTPVPTDTPAPTATPVPTQTIDVIVNLLKPVVEGTGVPEAAAYDPDKPGIHPLIFISPINQGVYDISLPKTWIPPNIGQAELVAVLQFNYVLIDWRRYRQPDIVIGRYRTDTDVYIHEARTGKLIASTTFQGGLPLPFPSVKTDPRADIKGDAPYAEMILIWLKQYVEK
jgi:hypothetical protein